MIVFWRLLLTYYIGAVLFYNQRFFAWRDKHVGAASLLEGSFFVALAGGLCWPYLQKNWQLADVWPLPGWAGVLFVAVVYVLANRLFVFRKGQTRWHVGTFLAHETAIVLACLACAPLNMLYSTGNFMLEYSTVCAVGVLVVTKMFNIFIYMVELDWYRRHEEPTIDEGFLTMLMRLIFFLIVLLPGWRGLVWFLIWFWACGEAHQNRLIDFSRFALYFSVFGSAAVGLLVRISWYG